MNKTLGAGSIPNLSRNTSARYRSTGNLNSPKPRPVQPASSLTELCGEDQIHLNNLCSYLTARGADVGLPNKQWKTQDFGSLSSDDMLKIVILILREICPGMEDQQVHDFQPLPIYESLGLGPMTYDAGMDQVHKKIKGLFPEDDTLYNYSVLLLPSMNPKRTRAVLLYLVKFESFAAAMSQTIAENIAQVTTENKEKVDLFQEVESLKDSVQQAIQEREKGMHCLPVLNRELETVQLCKTQNRNKLILQEDELAKAKSMYRSMEQKIQEGNKKLMDLKLELSTLQQTLVQNPTLIKGDLEAAQREHEAELAFRVQINSDIAKANQDTDALISTNANVKKILKELTDSVEAVDQLRSKHSTVQAANNDAKSKEKLLEEAKRKIYRLRESHSLKCDHITQLQIRHEREMDQLGYQVANGKEEIPKTIEAINALKTKIFEIQETISEKQTETEKVARVIAEHVEELNSVLPQLFATTKQNAEEFLQRVNAEFSHYPNLNQTDH